MTLLIYYTALWYWSAPVWLWVAGAAVWVLHLSWHWEQTQSIKRLFRPYSLTRKVPPNDESR